MAILFKHTKPYLCAAGFSLVLSACGGGNEVIQSSASNPAVDTTTPVAVTPPTTENVTPVAVTPAAETPASIPTEPANNTPSTPVTTPTSSPTPEPVVEPVVEPAEETPAPVVDPNLIQSTFSAPIISGLNYTTASQNGSTSNNGEFSYLPNENITFSIGDIRFDTINAQNINSLFELAQTHIISDTRYINMARLLYTLDADGNPNNGIQISALTHTMAEGVTADFSSANFDAQVASLVSSSQNPNTVLLNIQQARNNITAQLDTDRSCARTSAKVGQVADLSMIDHDVSGRLRVLNDCTIEVSQFFYDGGGLGNVRFYNLDNSDIYGDNLADIVHTNETFLLKVTPEQLEEIDSISVWCIPFGISFGDGTFR